MEKDSAIEELRGIRLSLSLFEESNYWSLREKGIGAPLICGCLDRTGTFELVTNPK